MKPDLIRLWKVLSLNEKRKIIYVCFFLVFSAVMDLMGIISFIPFLTVLANEELLVTNPILSNLKNFFNFDNNEQFLILLALFSFVVLLINQATRIFSKWYQTYVQHEIWLSFHEIMFKYYLEKPYIYHLTTSSNKILEKLQVQVNAAVAGLLLPFFNLLNAISSTLLIFLVLFMVEPIVTVLLLIITSIFYFGIYKKIIKHAKVLGEIGPVYSSKAFKIIDQAFNSIKEIKIKNNGNYYLNLFHPIAKLYMNAQTNIQLYLFFPIGLLEVFAFGIALTIIMYLLANNENFLSTIPIIGLYAISLKRILPAINSIYQQVTTYQYYKPSFDVIYEDLLESREKEYSYLGDQKDKFFLKNNIKLENISFEHHGSNEKTLKKISMDIPAHSIVGIAGITGSGKTTLVDMIAGLLIPDSGQILIDNKQMYGKLSRTWQNNLGYIPQSSFLANDTIINNVALGVNEKDIEINKIKEIADITQISTFIENNLPNKYQTLVGERGIRLSGGQRQLLTIARALYSEPDILIMDEATSSLDGITEEKLIHSIRKNFRFKTIIMIAHRLSTLKECDNIFLMDKGKVIDSGSYDYLIKNNLIFKQMSGKTRTKFDDL